MIYFIGIVIEPIDPSNPSAGTKLTQVNSFDINGNMPAVMQDQMMPHMVTQNLESWTSVFSKAWSNIINS